MNDELKAVHMQTITHPDAVRMYDDLLRGLFQGVSRIFVSKG